MKKQVTDNCLLESMLMGERYTARRLASTHGASEHDVRQQLIRLAEAGLLRNEVFGKAFVYAKVAIISAGLPAMAQMKISREMQVAMERTKELRRHKSKF